MKSTVVIATVMVAAVLVGAAAFVILTNSDERHECDVVVTMGWQKEIVDEISQGQLNTVVLMPENANPHSFSSSSSSIQYLYNATLFIEIGSGVDWEDGLLKNNVRSDILKSGTNIVSCADLINHDHEHSGECDHNSHIWVNPEYLGDIATELRDVLKSYFSWLDDDGLDEGLAYYLYEKDRHGESGGLKHIKDLVEEIVSGSATRFPAVPGQTVFVWHNAWDPLIDYINEVASAGSTSYYIDHDLRHDDPKRYDNSFIRIISGEDFGGGAAPTVSTVDNMAKLSGTGMTNIYVSPFDVASQYGELFKEHGFEIVPANPTAGNWLSALDGFLHDLRGELAPVRGATVNFNVVGNIGGTLDAKVNAVVDDDYGLLTTVVVGGSEFLSGSKFLRGANIMFTATPDEGYQVKQWTLNGAVVPGTSAEFSRNNITGIITVTVEFELIT